MLDRIENLVRNIREMSDNIAHDLKNPITRIRGVAEITLVCRDDMDEYKSMAANAIEESDRLLDMINTMLVISKAEAGAGEFVFEKIDLSTMINEACELFSPLAEDRGIVFECRIEETCVVEADIRMLQRAFSNLVDNAIKYTSKGGQIKVSMEKQPDGMVHIGVEDTGVGIEKGHFEKIFDRFYRADPSRSREGAGLGLSLARTVSREHSGDIKVSSKKGQGTTFLLTLPYCNLQVI
jgi:signal transduction histidine kinase